MMTAGDLVGALAKAQGQFQPILRAREGQARGGRYKYAELADVLASVLPALSSNGLAVTQTLRPVDDWMALVTTLMHTGGGSIESVVPIVVDGNPQVFGSSMTYLRRYSLLALLGVAAEDDDGQAAADQPAEEKATRRSSGGTYQTSNPPKGSSQPEVRDRDGNVVASCASYGQVVDYIEGLDIEDKIEKSRINLDLLQRVAGSDRAPAGLRKRATTLIDMALDDANDQE
jgi:hypothetical protein